MERLPVIDRPPPDKNKELAVIIPDDRLIPPIEFEVFDRFDTPLAVTKRPETPAVRTPTSPKFEEYIPVNASF